jgi:dsRNA-specific ribonuclease
MSVKRRPESDSDSNSSYSSDETRLITPYNFTNNPITEKALQHFFSKGGIHLTPNNLKIYQQAFVHRSYVKHKVKAYVKRHNGGNAELEPCPEGCMNLCPDCNERLEFLGDSIVGATVVSYLYRRFSENDEGFMTKLKTRLVKTNTLASFANYLGLGQFMVISKHVEDRCGGRTNPRMLEDLFEAFIGAMYLDFSDKQVDALTPMNLFYGIGYSVCETFLINIIEKRVDFEDLIMKDENYKDILLRHFQQRYQQTPKYLQLELSGNGNSRKFTMGVLDPGGNVIGRGTESSKKKAEQIASKEALIGMGVVGRDD